MAASRWMVTGSWGTTERHNDQSRDVCSFTLAWIVRMSRRGVLAA